MFEFMPEALTAAFSLANMLALISGTFLGIVVGIMPGIGPMVGMVVILPFTFSLAPDIALSLLLGVYCGGYFGGAVPAILMRTPGVPSSLITSFDGFPLTQQGKAQTALSAALVGSFGGGIISIIILFFLARLLAHAATKFGSPEYFAVGFAGVVLVVMSSRKHITRGVLLLCLGLWLSCVGIDSLTIRSRYCFGILSMQAGLNIVPVCLGLFGIGQTLLLVERKILKSGQIHLTRRTLDFSKLIVAFKYWQTLIKSGVIGTILGLLPGFGSIMASFLSYQEAKRSSENPDEFGKGTPEGCIAAEAGNNAVPAGAMIPLLTLGIPGDALSAVLMGIFTINGIYPGPLLLIKEPVLINTLYLSMMLINIFAFLMLALWLRPFAMIVKVNSSILAVMIMAISTIGIYAVNTSMFDVCVALVAGVLGYILLRMQWPVVNLVVGIVLGSILEEKLRESLSLFEGNFLLFFTRPIPLAVALMTCLLIVFPLIMKFINSQKHRQRA